MPIEIDFFLLALLSHGPHKHTARLYPQIQHQRHSPVFKVQRGHPHILFIENISLTRALKEIHTLTQPSPNSIANSIN